MLTIILDKWSHLKCGLGFTGSLKEERSTLLFSDKQSVASYTAKKQYAKSTKKNGGPPIFSGQTNEEGKSRTNDVTVQTVCVYIRVCDMCARYTYEHAVFADKTKVTTANTFAAVNRSKAFSPVDGPAHLSGDTEEVHEACVCSVPAGQDHLVGKVGGIERHKGRLLFLSISWITI